MFSGGYRGQKLKTNLRLTINRCKLLEKKKTEMALKDRKEIADYLQAGKDDRAKIRVEHIIREDYYVEALEVVELYSDLLMARYGLIESMKYCDESILEAVTSLIWVEPRMRSDVQELKVVADQLILKYGKEFGQAAKSDANGTVNEKLKHRLSAKAPPKTLVENYLIEIAKNYNVPYEPDQSILHGEESLIGFDLGDPPAPPSDGASGGKGGGGGGGGGGQKQPLGPAAPYGSYPPPPPGSNPAAVPPYMPPHQSQGPMPPASRPTDSMPPSYNGAAAAPQNMPAPPYSANDPAYPPQYHNNTAPYPQQNNTTPYPQQPIEGIPELPSVPAASFPPLDNTVGENSAGGEDVDFDDLSRRFEELKKKK